MATEAQIRANRLNAWKGGKPKGMVHQSTLTAIEARKWFVEQVHKDLKPIYEALYKKAMQGDIMAIKEILDRAWGKAAQGLYQSDQQGNPIVFMPLELMQKHDIDIPQQKVIDVKGEENQKK